MAETNNFYGWLELPVEPFESDPERLRKRAEEKITEWNSKSAGTKEYTRAQLYGDQIYSSIADVAQWERIYEEYKAETEEKIRASLTLYLTSENTVTKSVINMLAKEFAVSSEFVEEIAGKHGLYAVFETEEPASGRITLEQVQPDRDIQDQLKNLQEYLTSLSCETVFDFINEHLKGVHVSPDTPQELIEDYLVKIRKQTKRSITFGLPSKKTLIEKIEKSKIELICLRMILFFKTNSLDDFIRFDKWIRLQNILRDLEQQKVTELDQLSFETIVERIFEIWGNRREAQALLEDYCSGKQIMCPRSLSDETPCTDADP